MKKLLTLMLAVAMIFSFASVAMAADANVSLVYTPAGSGEGATDTGLQMQRGGLSPVDPGGNSFLIVFANGEFDIISIVGSTHCKYDDGVINSWISFLRSNEMEYEQLLNKYLNA